MTDDVRYEIRGSAAVLTLNRPEQRNTVTFPMLDALLAGVRRAVADDDVRSIVFTGAGEHFSYGTDLSGGEGFAVGSRRFKPLRGGNRDVGGELSIAIFDSPKPVIAAVNGTAVGIGVTMILPMDIRIGCETARFGLPFVRRGILPESCGTWFLPRAVGINRAMDWVATGRIFPAAEALDAGLVRELVPPGRVLERALEVAEEIAVNAAPVSVALARQIMWRLLSSDHPMDGNVLESQALAALTRMPDVQEGIAAFKEKRPPAFPSTVSADMPAFYPWWTEPTFPDLPVPGDPPD